MADERERERERESFDYKKACVIKLHWLPV